LLQVEVLVSERQLAVVQAVDDERREVAETSCDEAMQLDIGHLLQNVTDECQV